MQRQLRRSVGVRVSDLELRVAHLLGLHADEPHLRRHRDLRLGNGAVHALRVRNVDVQDQLRRRCGLRDRQLVQRHQVRSQEDQRTELRGKQPVSECALRERCVLQHCLRSARCV